MTSMTLGDKPQIDISIQDPQWNDIDRIEEIIFQAATLTLDMAILPRQIEGRDYEASIVLANDDLLQVLNREYRGKDKPTNVLTFASLDSDDMTPDGEILNLGDVLLSFQTIEREAREQGKFFIDHLRHMLVHGVLHLLGYDHETDEEATDMETLEIRILEKMDVQNPYTEIDL